MSIKMIATCRQFIRSHGRDVVNGEAFEIEDNEEGRKEAKFLIQRGKAKRDDEKSAAPAPAPAKVAPASAPKPVTQRVMRATVETTPPTAAEAAPSNTTDDNPPSGQDARVARSRYDRRDLRAQED